MGAEGPGTLVDGSGAAHGGLGCKGARREQSGLGPPACGRGWGLPRVGVRAALIRVGMPPLPRVATPPSGGRPRLDLTARPSRRSARGRRRGGGGLSPCSSTVCCCSSSIRSSASVGQASGAETFLRDVTSVALALLYYGYLNGVVGQTVGKMVMNVRAVDRDTGRSHRLAARGHPVRGGRGVEPVARGARDHRRVVAAAGSAPSVPARQGRAQRGGGHPLTPIRSWSRPDADGRLAR